MSVGKMCMSVGMSKCPLAKCPLAKCLLARCPLAKCPLAKCALAKRPLAKCPLIKCSDTRKLYGLSVYLINFDQMSLFVNITRHKLNKSFGLRLFFSNEELSRPRLES